MLIRDFIQALFPLVGELHPKTWIWPFKARASTTILATGVAKAALLRARRHSLVWVRSPVSSQGITEDCSLPSRTRGPPLPVLSGVDIGRGGPAIRGPLHGQALSHWARAQVRPNNIKTNHSQMTVVPQLTFGLCVMGGGGGGRLSGDLSPDPGQKKNH